VKLLISHWKDETAVSKDGAKVDLEWEFIPLAGFNHQLRS
jgi:hypothetical protein